LPVDLLYFDAEEEVDGIVQLNWATASEINNKHFLIERSQNAIDFEEIDIIEGMGNSSIVVEYNSKDEHPNLGTSYYRLKQVDFNGEFEYSAVVSVLIEKLSSTSSTDCYLYPNPISKTKNLTIVTNEMNEQATIKLYDVVGKLVCQSEESNKYQYTLLSNTLGGLATGLYNLVIQTPEKRSESKLVITE
jgi:hypothetical protein